MEIRDVLARSDLYERAGKNQHGLYLSAGREYSYGVRVLANARPDSYSMDTMLHESGHAVYDEHTNPRFPYFLRPHLPHLHDRGRGAYDGLFG